MFISNISGIIRTNDHFDYYVDATSGNDGNAGTSPDQAWQTMAKLAGFGFSAGDRVGLKRGEVWRETWYVNTGGNSNNHVVYGAYGLGPKPKITGCDLLTGWTLTGGSIYQASYVESIDTYILLEDGEHLTKVANLGALTAAGQFFPDNANDLIYAWCTDGADPDTHTMEIGARYDAVSCDDRQYITFEDLHFHGAGGQYGRNFGVKPTWNTPSDIILDQCEISHAWYCGVWAAYAASFLAIDNLQLRDCQIHKNLNVGVRVEGEDAGHKITNFLLKGGTIYDNGLAANAGFGVWPNFCDSPQIINAEIYDNNGSLEWSDNLYIGHSPNVTVKNNIFHGGNHSAIHLDVGSFGIVHQNICYGCGYNGIWIEEHQTGSGHATTVYNNTCYDNRIGIVFGPGSTIFEVSGVTVKNNIFSGNHYTNFELNEDGVGADYLNNDVDYNCYFGNASHPDYQGEFRAESPRVNKTFADWKTYTSWDAHSINVDPQMTQPAAQNFTLAAGSLCINTGVDVGLPYSGAAPNMGAL